ncbi:MAG: dihydroxyacetone kinase subunit L [Erysipelothrix sp.]|nr:dihydroxyacetone kinase subunit L [Erysipelothrix sp.]
MVDAKLLQFVKDYANLIAENQAQLNAYDTPIGDGDHGTNMNRGMQAVLEMLETKEITSNQDLFKNIGMTLLSKVGGASGPLYGSAFITMAKTIDNTLTQDVIKAGYESVAKRGKSTVNEKTMLDVWGPVSEMDLTQLTVEDVERFAASTEPMRATKGRASFLGDRSIGHRDPGSHSSALFFEAAINAGVLA